MRVTRRRVAIIESLLSAKGPVSIDRIHQAVGISSCDLVTVYRCLSAFERLGIVRRSYLHHGTCLYELILSGTQHYHIVCKACGSTSRVECYPMQSVEQVLQKRGYTEISHIVEFFGVCPNCQQVAPDRNVSAKIPSVRS